MILLFPSLLPLLLLLILIYIHLSNVWQLLRLLRPKLQPQELLISCCELHA